MTRRRVVVVGQGRVGGNIALWLERLGHDVVRRGRDDVESPGAVENADVIMLAVPDGAIGELARRILPRIGQARMVHFSGALLVGHALSYHPLYSFPKTALAPEAFARIPFARQEGAPPLATLVPG
ncbi:MAG: hypothetical protein K2Q06_11875, partial [Parvularculaceae bacterium]|nr:hypothetical protein [Parvularculaceae bacterium]